MVFLPAAKNTLPPSRVAYVHAVIRYTEIGGDGNCRYCLVLYFHQRARIPVSENLPRKRIDCINSSGIGSPRSRWPFDRANKIRLIFDN